MKTTKILYWVFNALFAALMFSSAIPDVMLSPEAVKFMHDVLGYPLYFVPFIGVVKILGVIALFIPGFPRLKEWAYAGLIFDLVGASYSVYSVPQPEGSPLFMLLPLSLAAAAYIFYRKKQKLSGEADASFATA